MPHLSPSDSGALRLVSQENVCTVLHADNLAGMTPLPYMSNSHPLRDQDVLVPRSARLPGDAQVWQLGGNAFQENLHLHRDDTLRFDNQSGEPPNSHVQGRDVVGGFSMGRTQEGSHEGYTSPIENDLLDCGHEVAVSIRDWTSAEYALLRG
jgi:hypothetical protein